MTRVRNAASTRRHFLLSTAVSAAVGTLATVGLTAPAFAQSNYPNKPIRLVVPFAAGGSTDLSARLVAEFAGRELGQTIVVDNKGGAGGSIGMEQVACHAGRLHDRHGHGQHARVQPGGLSEARL
jgi:tripartite-type tricarboxylate transporter receptor subunit TctC